MSVLHGTFSLTRAAAEEITFLEGDGEQDRAMVFAGSLRAVNNALSASLFRSALNWNSYNGGLDAITVTVSDGVDTSSPPAVLLVRVLPENDPPVIDVHTAGAVYDAVETYADKLSHVQTTVETVVVPEDVEVCPLADWLAGWLAGWIHGWMDE